MATTCRLKQTRQYNLGTTHDIVAKLCNLCNVFKDDGVTYHQYVTELTYLLFLKMAKETSTEEHLEERAKEKNPITVEDIPKGYRWDDLECKPAPDRLEFYKILLIHLGSAGSTLVKEIFANASSFVRKPATLSTLVTEIDKLDVQCSSGRAGQSVRRLTTEERQRKKIWCRAVFHATSPH